MTLQEAKDYIKENQKKGLQCPCCEGYVKLYKRKLNSGMAKFLIALYKRSQTEIPSCIEDILLDLNTPAKSLDYSVLTHWGLIQRVVIPSTEKKHSGLWEITPTGREFVLGVAMVAKRVHIINNVVVGFDEEQISIKEALGQKFNYIELMRT